MPKFQGLTEIHQKIVDGRDKFGKEYCIEKKWDFNNLTFKQILEIRKQLGWQNPK